MGAAVNKSAAMVVASPSFVVALANDFSDFGAMSCSLPPVGMSQLPGLRRDRKKSCDGNHNLVESEKHAGVGRPTMNGAKSNSRVDPAGAQKWSRRAVRTAAPA